MIYNSTIDMMRMKVPEWDGKHHDIIIIKHDFDTDWLLLALEELEIRSSSISFDMKV